MPDSKVIYLVWADTTNKFKIGCTGAAPEKRKQELQIGSCHKLHLLAHLVFSSNEIESRIHKFMEDKSIGGEWFQLTPMEIKELLTLFESCGSIMNAVKDFERSTKFRIPRSRKLKSKKFDLDGVGEKILRLLSSKGSLKAHQIKSSIADLKPLKKEKTEEVLGILVEARLLKVNKKKEYSHG